MKMTKTQAKRRMNEILSKAQNLFLTGYLSQNDFSAIQKIIDKGLKKC